MFLTTVENLYINLICLRITVLVTVTFSFLACFCLCSFEERLKCNTKHALSVGTEFDRYTKLTGDGMSVSCSAVSTVSWRG